ncbi:type II secretion system protein [Sporosarcina sp. P17b]|uniref:type II secretion system protein n=1 Tax=Sporosarcina sp. P17b TaxID=2048260 RepID=UPI000C1667D4|nr:type II secretion system protein [Sporosarcina sp. P17b]PIC72779.1 hypothetical protein CSV76_13140 [Sporosarcina sp. P17b]
MRWKNERGFTLVEILASLTILGIVFISFMTIFPQMVNVNDRTGTKLDTMNVAKKLLNEIRDSEGDLPSSYVLVNYDDSKKEVYYKVEREGYQIALTCLPRDETSPMCSKTITEKASNVTDLYKIHIQVTQQDKLISETFGYAKLK